jgi:hypothetical protein
MLLLNLQSFKQSSCLIPQNGWHCRCRSLSGQHRPLSIGKEGRSAALAGHADSWHKVRKVDKADWHPCLGVLPYQ